DHEPEAGHVRRNVPAPGRDGLRPLHRLRPEHLGEALPPEHLAPDRHRASQAEAPAARVTDRDGRAAGVDRAPGRAPRELIVGGHAASLGVPQVVKWTTADALCPPSVATTFTTWSWPEESVTSNDVPACSK